MLFLYLLSYITSYNTPRYSIFGQDKTPPTAIKFIPIPPTEVTKATLDIKGNAEAESKLEVYLNENLIYILNTEDKSKFDFNINLKPGQNYLWIIPTDRNGNVGESSGNQPINFKTS